MIGLFTISSSCPRRLSGLHPNSGDALVQTVFTPQHFGATGQGLEDDTVPIQKAFDAGFGGAVHFPPGKYRVSRSIAIPSNCDISGYGAHLTMTTDDLPALVSENLLTNKSIGGNLRVRGLTIEGTGAGSNQHGLLLRDFWSTLSDLSIINTGGHGICFVDRLQKAPPVTGTLVENRILNCDIRGVARCGVWIGEAANRRLTDGFISGLVISQKEHSNEPAVFIGHSAGWQISNLHIYGGNADDVVLVANAYFTSLSNLYVEGFRRTVVALPSLQNAIHISGIHARSSESQRPLALVTANRNSGFPQSIITLSNVYAEYHRAGSLQPILTNDPAIKILQTNVSLFGY
jgi:hypothetical protein